MALKDDPTREYRRKQREEAIKNNPLLGMGLGDLVAELYKIYALDPNVIKPENEIPKKSLPYYKKYRAIIDELNARDRKYTEPENPLIG